MLKNKRGQSTLEYIILMTAVVVAIVAFLVSPGSPFKSSLNKTLNTTTGAMETVSGKLTDTFQ
ncbi:MAG: class III signal peptide-containing protein [Candidatus Omnitrophota bacterium]